MFARSGKPAEALKMATADNGESMGLSGFINPTHAKFRVVKQGQSPICC
jgi:hypothetical protein